ncbi:MAG TPA: NrtA/SsuA/CpmA family ABC transporter substrate-binding protein [Xanthobacteraceae bacterium]|nr:NrtA/SsuA/CpmA family ABC transporter substrate-binding protein [Xanthobacteraceae bacterium]
MSRRHRTAAALAFLAAIAVTAAADAQTKEPIKIAIGVDAAFAPFYISKQNKLFEKHGVNVELVQFTQGGDALDAVAAGQMPLGGAAEPTTLIRAARTDIKVLGIYGQSGSYIKFVAKPGITDPKQARKLGVVPGSVSEFATEQMLAKLGVDRKSVELVKAGPPEFPALLARGDVDGYFLWEPWPTNGVKQGGKVLLTSGDVGYTYNMWLSASGAWLSAHQADAKAILAALAAACAIVRADPAAGAAAVQAEAKIPAATALESLKEIQCTVRDFTPADIASYDKIADFLAARKITPAKVDLSKVIQQGFYAPQ